VEVVWSPEARADLSAIRAYLRERNPIACRAVIAAIRAAGDSLGETPYKGHPGEEGTREWLVTRFPNYLLIYELRQSPASGRTTVVILSVWHQARARR
jgi:plasmid stabilization system protein ParE